MKTTATHRRQTTFVCLLLFLFLSLPCGIPQAQAADSQKGDTSVFLMPHEGEQVQDDAPISVTPKTGDSTLPILAGAWIVFVLAFVFCFIGLRHRARPEGAHSEKTITRRRKGGLS